MRFPSFHKRFVLCCFGESRTTLCNYFKRTVQNSSIKYRGHFFRRTSAGIAFSSWNEQPENITTALATAPLLKVKKWRQSQPQTTSTQSLNCRCSSLAHELGSSPALHWHSRFSFPFISTTAFNPPHNPDSHFNCTAVGAGLSAQGTATLQMMAMYLTLQITIMLLRLS